jgi:tRNA U34 2-thiouridine synthase MnmA/TrmU
LKAVSLFSGGLDSQLAISVIQAAGITVEAVNFKTPFYGGGLKLAEAADRLGVALKTIDISDDYMEVLRNPRYGYGKNMNPCIDCHGFMLRQAGEYMREIGASFIITGEVLGQRPMSQNRSALEAVDKLSGRRGLIVRPLSGKLLPPTVPEMEGWIERDALLDIKGRSRLRQMELAEQFHLDNYPSPAGGCLLTMENFSRRLKLLFQIKPDVPARQTELLKYGRLFTLEARALLAIGRKHSENEALLSIADESDYLLKVLDYPGPTSVFRFFSPVRSEDLDWAAALTARYSDGWKSDRVRVKVWQPGREETIVEMNPATHTEMPDPV